MGDLFLRMTRNSLRCSFSRLIFAQRKLTNVTHDDHPVIGAAAFIWQNVRREELPV